MNQAGFDQLNGLRLENSSHSKGALLVLRFRHVETGTVKGTRATTARDSTPLAISPARTTCQIASSHQSDGAL